jgi:hypothetical protein
MRDFPNVSYSTLIPTIGTFDTYIELSEDGTYFSVGYSHTSNSSIVIFYVSNLTIAATISTDIGSYSHVWSSDSKSIIVFPTAGTGITVISRDSNWSKSNQAFPYQLVMFSFLYKETNTIVCLVGNTQQIVTLNLFDYTVINIQSNINYRYGKSSANSKVFGIYSPTSSTAQFYRLTQYCAS